MSKNNDGGPAFPVADYDHRTFSPETVSETRRLLSGMSLRAYAAIQVAQGIVSNDEAIERFAAASKSQLIPPSGMIATAACQIADALIAELERDQ